ncbi:cytochrome b5-like Heme/Steroid binding domain-containing protein [Zalerion maritima]|uniref:Cytochrome b5-like Heme/Steroid binding domain-containing protein n=1 Tax=Zalerion maritima TaxID=339359 RepID=A0AAD5WUH4_9PEZI|nr:cytochrome b5-like Heme/Steroid binding domain-containing protein [Zalerion maritima]
MSYWANQQYVDPSNPTPWTDRFGQSVWASYIPNGPSISSGLNPIWPPIEPLKITDWDQVDKLSPEELDKTKPKNLAEWDHLFRTERLQMWRFPGLKSWQLSAWLKAAEGLESSVGGYPGDTSNLDQMEWPKAWGKHNWWDSSERIGEYTGFKNHWIPDLEEGEKWSVDNERVWNAMKPVLELATMLLRTLCVSDVSRPFMDMLLFGDESRLLGPRLIRKPLDHCHSGPEIWKEIRDLDMRDVALFLVDSQQDHVVWDCSRGGFEGLTHEWGDATSPGLRLKHKVGGVIRVLYSVCDLMTLLRRDATAYEKNIAAFNMATTLHHELIHTIRLHRLLQVEPRKRNALHLSVTDVCEPAVFMPHPHKGDIPMAENEWGQYTTSLLHGLPVYKLSDRSSGGGGVGGATKNIPRPSLGISFRNNLVSDLGSEGMWPRYYSRLGLCSVALPKWQNNLMDQGFWEGAVAKYGPRALQPPRPWMQLALRRWYKDANGSMIIYSSNLEGFPLSTENIAPWINELYRKELDELRQNMQNRGSKFRSFRGADYLKYHGTWQATPYANTTMRNHLKEFAHWHERRDTDRCIRIYWSLINYEYDRQGERSSLFWWAGPDEEDQMIFYATVGYMMAAVIPEPKDKNKPAPAKHHLTVAVEPSSSVDMTKGSLPAVRFTQAHFDSSTARIVVPDMKLKDGGNRLRKDAYLNTTSRAVYLTKALDGLRRLKDLQPCFVSQPLLRQLENALLDVQTRFNNRASAHSWLPWSFGSELVPYELPSAVVGARGGIKGRPDRPREWVRMGRTTTIDPNLDHAWGMDFAHHALDDGDISWKHAVWDESYQKQQELNGLKERPLGQFRKRICRTSKTGITNMLRGIGLGSPWSLGKSRKNRAEGVDEEAVVVTHGGPGPIVQPAAQEYYRPRMQQGIEKNRVVSGKYWMNEEDLLQEQASMTLEQRRMAKAQKPLVTAKWAQNGVRGVLPPDDACAGAECIWYVANAQPPDYSWRAWAWDPANSTFKPTDVVRPHPYVANAGSGNDGRLVKMAVPGNAGKRLDGNQAVVSPSMNAVSKHPQNPGQPSPIEPWKEFRQRAVVLNDRPAQPPMCPSKHVQLPGKAPIRGGFDDLGEKLGSAEPESKRQPEPEGPGDGPQGTNVDEDYLRGEVRALRHGYKAGEIVEAMAPKGAPGRHVGGLYGPAPGCSVADDQAPENIWNFHEYRRSSESRSRNGGARAKVVRVAGNLELEEPVRHWSTGEVGSHRALDDMWVIVSRGDGTAFQVFDITYALSLLKLDQPGAWPPGYVSITDRGRQYHDKTAPSRVDKIMHRNAVFMGYLLETVALEDVSERDGTYNSKLWVQIGRNVYDVSKSRPDDFTKEEWNVLRSQAGGNPTTLLRSLELGLEDIKQKLTPHRVGIVKLEKTSFPAQNNGRDLQWMTPRDVAWHKYPEESMWVTIDEEVYNLEEFADFHPGGIGVLRQLAGRDATDFFFREHGGEGRGRELLARWQQLKIGRMVDEVCVGNLGKHEIALNELVLDLSDDNIAKNPNKDLLESIRRDFGGQDVSRKGSPSPAMYDEKNDTWVYADGQEPDPRLTELKANITLYPLVVSKLMPDFQETITRDEMWSHGWDEDDPDNESWTYECGRRVWTSVDGIVYDITGTVLNPTARPDHKALLAPFAGTEVQGTASQDHARKVLKEYYGLRCVGKRMDMLYQWSCHDERGNLYPGKEAEHRATQTPRPPRTSEERHSMEGRRNVRREARLRGERRRWKYPKVKAKSNEAPMKHRTKPPKDEPPRFDPPIEENSPSPAKGDSMPRPVDTSLDISSASSACRPGHPESTPQVNYAALRHVIQSIQRDGLIDVLSDWNLLSLRRISNESKREVVLEVEKYMNKWTDFLEAFNNLGMDVKTGKFAKWPSEGPDAFPRDGDIKSGRAPNMNRLWSRARSAAEALASDKIDYVKLAHMDRSIPDSQIGKTLASPKLGAVAVDSANNSRGPPILKLAAFSTWPAKYFPWDLAPDWPARWFVAVASNKNQRPARLVGSTALGDAEAAGVFRQWDPFELGRKRAELNLDAELGVAPSVDVHAAGVPSPGSTPRHSSGPHIKISQIIGDLPAAQIATDELGLCPETPSWLAQDITSTKKEIRDKIDGSGEGKPHALDSGNESSERPSSLNNSNHGESYVAEELESKSSDMDSLFDPSPTRASAAIVSRTSSQMSVQTYSDSETEEPGAINIILKGPEITLPQTHASQPSPSTPTRNDTPTPLKGILKTPQSQSSNRQPLPQTPQTEKHTRRIITPVSLVQRRLASFSSMSHRGSSPESDAAVAPGPRHVSSSAASIRRASSGINNSKDVPSPHTAPSAACTTRRRSASFNQTGAAGAAATTDGDETQPPTRQPLKRPYFETDRRSVDDSDEAGQEAGAEIATRRQQRSVIEVLKAGVGGATSKNGVKFRRGLGGSKSLTGMRKRARLGE